jgi:Mg/Co/Ni transporter MgtE
MARPTRAWGTKSLALTGAVLGFVLGIIHAYVHAFWSQTHEEDPIRHILWSMALYVVVGAAFLATIAVIRNWLMRDR